MGDSKAEELKYEKMWGAKVMVPCDMPDDILQDAVTTAKTELEVILTEDRNQGLQNKGQELVKSLKKRFDEKWGASWHVVCGKSFGCYATHQSSKFVYFYVGNVAFMFYQT
eukprot:g1228.t1